MKTKKLIIILALVFFVLSNALPFLFKNQSETFNQTLNVCATLIAAICSVLTFVIAILLFNKFGIDAALMDKRKDIVFQLLEKISVLVYSVENEKYFFTIKLGTIEKEKLDEFYNRKLSFSIDYYNDLAELFQIANNPFTPISIFQKMQAIQPQVISFDIPEAEKDNYAKVYLFGHRKIDIQFGRLNMTDITLCEFIKPYSNLKNAVVQWIKNNTSINTSDLNI